MRGARLHRSVRISRGHELARTQGQRGKLVAENERSDLERLSPISLRFSRRPSVQRRLSSCRHGLGFARCIPRSFTTTNQRRNTSRPRSFEEGARAAAAKLCGKNREQSAQDGGLDPLSARLRYGRRSVTNRRTAQERPPFPLRCA